MALMKNRAHSRESGAKTAMQKQIMQQYQGNRTGEQPQSVFDRTNHVLHMLKRLTPATNVNQKIVNQIKAETKDKVSYAYKERFSGVYN